MTVVVKMKSYMKFLLLLGTVSVHYADTISPVQPCGPIQTPAPVVIQPGGPNIPVAPTWPPPCCSTRSGCDAATLSQYCLPLQCPNNCANIAQCSCFWPGTKEVIKPRKVTAVPRAPFCSNVINHPCPLFRCIDFHCPDPRIECTALQIQSMINSK